MRSQQRTLLLNAALLLVLLAVSAVTLKYQRMFTAMATGVSSAMLGPMAQRAHSFAEDLAAHTQRHLSQLTGDGQRDHRRLSFYPVASAVSFVSPAAHGDRGGTAQAKEAEDEAPVEAAAVVAASAANSAVRVRSSIISETVLDASRGGGVQGWCVQSERVEVSLPTPGPLRPARTTSSAPPATTTTTTTVAPQPRRVNSAPSKLPEADSAAVSSTDAESEEDAPLDGDAVQRHSRGTARKSGRRALRKANAVIVLMSPTFSSDTLSTVVELGVGTSMGTTTTGTSAELRAGDKSQIPVPAHNKTTSSAEPPRSTAETAPVLCRRCSRFLREMLPALEENYLRRYAYPVHIFHRGTMPNEVVQYITAVLPSATRLTIEDISGVLTEKVTVPSVAVLEPWLKELRSDLLYRKRFAAVTPAPPPTSTGTMADQYKTSPQAGGVTDAPRTATGNHDDAREPGTAKSTPTANSPTTPPAPSGSTVIEQSVEIAVRALRTNWELRRFWAGLLFLLPSLQGYDYFWYMDSQSLLTKQLSKDVLATVADKNCAVAYTRLEYVTHKRVPDLWTSLLAWNEQSVNSYFTQDELDRAGQWLFDGRSFYSGKVYASDCFIFSFAVMRHPAYLDFFQWIDSRAPYSLMKRQWSPMAVHTVLAELLMSKYNLDSCTLDPLSGYRFPPSEPSSVR